MANTEMIESLVAELVADISQYQKNFKEAVGITDRAVGKIDKGMAKAEGAIKRLGSVMASVAKTALRWGSIIGGVLGVGSVAGIVALANASLDATDQLGKLSTRLGISTEALGRLKYIASLSGLEFDRLTKFVQNTQRRIGEAANGNTKLSKTFSELGLSATQLSRMLPDEQFYAVLDALDKVEKQTDRTRIAFQLFEETGPELLQILDGGTKNLKAMAAEADRLGLTMSREVVRGVEDANNAMTALKSLFQGARDQIVAALAPALTELVTLIKDNLLTAIEENGGSVEGWARKVAEDIITMVQRVISAIQKMVDFSVSAAKRVQPILNIGTKNYEQEVDATQIALAKAQQELVDAAAAYERITADPPSLFPESQVGIARKQIELLEGDIEGLQKKLVELTAGGPESVSGAFEGVADDITNALSSAYAELDRLKGVVRTAPKPGQGSRGDAGIQASQAGETTSKVLSDFKEGALNAGEAIRQSFDKLALDVRHPIQSIADSIQNAFLNAANTIFSNVIGGLLERATTNLLGGTLLGGLLGFAGGGQVNQPSMVNERGMESLKSGKGLFIPIGGPATVRNAADTRSMGGGGVVFSPVYNIQVGTPDQLRAELRNIATQAGADGARLILNAAGGIV